MLDTSSWTLLHSELLSEAAMAKSNPLVDSLRLKCGIRNTAVQSVYIHSNKQTRLSLCVCVCGGVNPHYQLKNKDACACAAKTQCGTVRAQRVQLCIISHLLKKLKDCRRLSVCLYACACYAGSFLYAHYGLQQVPLCTSLSWSTLPQFG